MRLAVYTHTIGPFRPLDRLFSSDLPSHRFFFPPSGFMAHKFTLGLPVIVLSLRRKILLSPTQFRFPMAWVDLLYA